MLSREENIDREARELWLALRNEAPPVGLTGSDLLLLLVAQAPELDYDRYASPHLRESLITRPRPEPPPLSARGAPSGLSRVASPLG